MGLFSLFKPGKTVVVVDGVSLNEASGSKGNAAPRNQLQLLRRLSRFAEREKLDVVAVLSGTPLNKAPAGKKFEQVTVLYSPSADAHPKHLVKVARSKGSGAVLVSGNAAVEKLALGSGTRTMRLSTFRKAFDIGSDGGESQERNGGRNRPRRRPQRGGKNGEPRGRQQERPAKKPESSSEADAISELIDLVE